MHEPSEDSFLEVHPIRLCFLTPRFPYPLNKGDKLRVYHQLRVLAARHQITLLSLADEKVSPEALAEVGRYCEIGGVVRIYRAGAALNLARGLVDGRPLQLAYYASSRFAALVREQMKRKSFDVLHASTARMVPYLQGLDPQRIVLDLPDAQSLGIRSRRDRTLMPMRLFYELELERIERCEREIVQRFPRIVVTGEADRAELNGSNVVVIRNGVDLARFPYAEEGRDANRIILTGNMGYQPNVDGALWFAQRVWPRLRARSPDLRWTLVGSRPAAGLRAFHGRDGIEVVGPVEDLGAHLRNATIAIAPILCGAGIQNKVLEAFASGTPIVATSFANEGVQATEGEHLRITDDPERFADALTELLEDPAGRLTLARNAHAFVEQTFTWEAHGEQMERLYRNGR